MSRSVFSILLLLPILIFSCKDSGSSYTDVTKLYPLNDGTEWTYLMVTDEDTSEVYTDFDVSQLSDNSTRVVLEVYSLEMSEVLVFEGRDSGICIDQYDGTFEEAKSSINSLENSQCALLLKTEAPSGSSYKFDYKVSKRNYIYEVEVSKEEVSINGNEYQTTKYEIPAGNQSSDFLIMEVYFNKEVGIVKFVGEYVKGSTPGQYLILKSIST